MDLQETEKQLNIERFLHKIIEINGKIPSQLEHANISFSHTKSSIVFVLTRVAGDRSNIGTILDAVCVALSNEMKTQTSWKIQARTPNKQQQLLSNLYGIEENVKAENTFGSFVKGNSNQVAYIAAENTALQNKMAANPLLIYGASGLGKTHLLSAIYNQILHESPQKKVAFTRAEKFMRDMIFSLQNKCMDRFDAYYRKTDVLLLDDVHFLSSKEKTQEEFFYTFNTLLDNNKILVFTSDQYPKKINNLEDRIKSRLGMGVSIRIQPPEYETRVEILLRKAKDLQLSMDDDVAYLIAHKIKSNVRELEGALITLRSIAVELVGTKHISADIAQHALDELFSYHTIIITVEEIQKLVAEYFKVRIIDLLGGGRTRTIVRPRQLAMSLTKQYTSMSFPEIGKNFGNRDHTTVIHATKKIKDLLKTDQGLAKDYQILEKMIST